MIFDPKLLDSLGELQPTTWEGTVYRHMFASYPPERENTSGARWNPPEVAAIYACLERETLLAEVEHQMVSQPIPLKRGVRRTIYIIKVRLHSVLDLSSREELDRFGITARVLADYP